MGHIPGAHWNRATVSQMGGTEISLFCEYYFNFISIQRTEIRKMQEADLQKKQSFGVGGQRGIGLSKTCSVKICMLRNDLQINVFKAGCTLCTCCHTV